MPAPTPTSASARVPGCVQPRPGAVERVYNSTLTEVTDNTKPARSNRPGLSWRVSLSQITESTRATVPIGPLIRKIQRHETPSTRMPPISGPIAGAITATLNTPIAAVARSSSGKAR